MKPEEQFQAVVLARLDEASQLLGHSFAKLRDLIAERGGVDAARYLMSPSTVGTFTYGFKLLVSSGLLSHTIEQAVIDFEHTKLFTSDQISKARATIATAKLLGLVRPTTSSSSMGHGE